MTGPRALAIGLGAATGLVALGLCMRDAGWPWLVLAAISGCLVGLGSWEDGA